MSTANLCAVQWIDETDCFFVNSRGEVSRLWVVGTGTWNGPTTLTEPKFAPAGAAMAAGVQPSGQLDLFVVDNTGAVNLLLYEAGEWDDPVALTGPNFAPPGAAMAVGYQGNQQLQFVVDNQGRVNVLGTRNLRGPMAITAPDFAPQGAAIAVSQQTANQLDLFVVDNSGTVQAFGVVGNGPWFGAGPLSAAGFATPGASVVAQSQPNPNGQLDVFVIDQEGRVNMFWVTGTGNWNGPKALTSINFTGSGASLAAGPQTTNQIDLFVVDAAGAVNILYVVATGSWNGPYRLTGTQFAPAGAPLATAGQTSNQIDLFVSQQSAISLFWAVAAAPWKGPGVLVQT